MNITSLCARGPAGRSKSASLCARGPAGRSKSAARGVRAARRAWRQARAALALLLCSASSSLPSKRPPPRCYHRASSPPSVRPPRSRQYRAHSAVAGLQQRFHASRLACGGVRRWRPTREAPGRHRRRRRWLGRALPGTTEHAPNELRPAPEPAPWTMPSRAEPSRAELHARQQCMDRTDGPQLSGAGSEARRRLSGGGGDGGTGDLPAT